VVSVTQLDHPSVCSKYASFFSSFVWMHILNFKYFGWSPEFFYLTLIEPESTVRTTRSEQAERC
jgi:hypothetical protein